MRWETREEKVETIEGFNVRFITMKSGRQVTFFDAEREARDNWSSVVRWFYRMTRLAPPKAEKDDIYWRNVEYFLDRVEAFTAFWREELAKHDTRATMRERIEQLRNVSGRTPEEAALYLAKADKLEREMDAA